MVAILNKCPKKEAEHLIKQFSATSAKMSDHSTIYTPTAKSHAEACINYVLAALFRCAVNINLNGGINNSQMIKEIDYYQEVKQEIINYAEQESVAIVGENCD